MTSITADDLIELIHSHDPRALVSLQNVTDYCQSSRGQTLLDAAIISNNRSVLDVLVADKKAREFSVPVDDELTTAISYMLRERDIGYPLDRAEQRLRASFGAELNLGRTPLLTACRVGNNYALATLLMAGAKPTAKDRLKLTAPEICFYARGPEALETFIDQFGRSGQKPFAANATLVRNLLHYPTLLNQLKSVADFGTPVQKLLFCYDCARLDVDAVRKTLGSTFDINKSISADLHPVLEACLSQILWSDRLPDAGFYAYHYTKYMGPAGSHAVHFDNSLLNPDGSNFGLLMREAERQRQQLINEAKQLSLSEAASADQLKKRCTILDLMVEAGLDSELAISKLGESFFNHIRQMPLEPLVQHLCKHRLMPNAVEEAEPYSEASWDLVGESVLQAKLFDAKDGWTFKLVYSNVYCPVEGVIVNTRVGDSRCPTPHDEPSQCSDWREHAAQEQWLRLDGQRVPRQSVREPIYDETPWEAIYQWTQADKPESLEIWVQSPSENISWVLADWEIH
ncbi:MAG: hypothetical protein V4805_13160 [Pseudomonadota bacterium]